MSRNPFAYARLGNCEKSSASISASRAGRIFVIRAASSSVRFLAWFSAFARTQNTALLQNINDARSARIAESQAALQQRSGGAFFLPNDLKALLDQLFIFARHVFFRSGCGLQFLMHFHVKSGRALSRNEFHQAMNFIVRYEYALCANKTRSARRQIQHVPLPKQAIGSVLIKDNATVDLRGDLKSDSGRNVRLD